MGTYYTGLGAGSIAIAIFGGGTRVFSLLYGARIAFEATIDPRVEGFRTTGNLGALLREVVTALASSGSGMAWTIGGAPCPRPFLEALQGGETPGADGAGPRKERLCTPC